MRMEVCVEIIQRHMVNNNVLVTGGCGFLGFHLVNKLVEQGRNVKVYDAKDCKNKDVNFLKGDVRDFEKLKNFAKDVNVIFHLASLVPQSKVDLQAYKTVIVEGTENVLKICKENKIKMVHVSSSGVYGGERGKPLKEDNPKNPSGGYGTAKLEAELKCMEYAKQGVHVVMLRPMAIIGPGIYGVFKTYMNFVRYNLPLITFGDGSNRIQMVSVYDCVDALLLAEKYKKSGEAFNLGSDNIPTLKEQFKALIKHAKSKSIIIPLPAEFARKTCKIFYNLKLSPLTPEHYYVLDKDSILDNTKAKKELGWNPKRNNIEMNIEAYDWLVKTKDI